ncbi:Protein kinase domain-containing protein [Fusarium keratoplasticum]|uniref:Protein kinase domain-containing protein n=1 Tax=Fusarium keratoplasticum TaxID=1328300 RepID=A0ACC0QH60_9HYPO|nr:Protein kinase domain-containing protein [Fusarium keratoplasticum]KAI8651033.1 Protein kinase domain-containing protein [Fusarium keratoplasticum]
MDWSQDSSLYDTRAPRNVFKYSEMATTIVRLSPDSEKPVIWTMENMEDWNEWFETEYPALDGSESGLVLILARRNGERDFPPVRQVRSDEWLERIKRHETDQPRELPTSSNKNGQRTLRILPFSQDSFHTIVKKFYVHSMIARAISRADIPTFSAAEVEMGPENEQTYPAFVYNCRTSNAWEGDLALTATYFPHCKLTFAIMFGCPISTEKQVLQRLGKVEIEADHPLLMPGILVELERQRHVCLVDDTVNELETQILEIDTFSEDLELMSTEEQARRKQAKRAAWLDTTYLRNQLSNWIVNLEKLQDHADELNHTIFKLPKGPPSAVAALMTRYRGPQEPSEVFYDCCSRTPRLLSYDEPTEGIDLNGDGEKGKAYSFYPLEKEFCEPSQPQQPLEADQVQEAMERAGNRIKSRLRDIIDEYHEKVRDCTMRVDGMAMATQWAQGETNLEIAIAASRDSRHMRSIAVITMIFLPGTFFASIFSMGLFDWGAAGHGEVVSGYFWIYVVLATSFTFVTLSTWWYIGVYRHSRRKENSQGSKWLCRVKARILSLNRKAVDSMV